MARALKYNLDHRVALMEHALEERLSDSAGMDLLPELAGRAGLRTRDNTAASSSRSVRTGRQSLEPSTSTDRDSGTADLQLSLNVLDFGLSYFGAKAQGNRALAAEERRRRVVLTVADQVRAGLLGGRDCRATGAACAQRAFRSPGRLALRPSGGKRAPDATPRNPAIPARHAGDHPAAGSAGE